MQIKEFDVIIDIKDLKKVKYRDPISKKAIQEITVVREDNLGNQLNIYLEDGENPYLIGDSKVQIVFKKHDKTTVEMSRESGDFEVVDNVIKCVLSTNVIAIAGRQVQAEAIVSDINGRQVTSAKFYFRVTRGLLTDDMVKSTNEFSTLDRLIGNVQELEDTVLDNINDANSVLNTTIEDAELSRESLIETIATSGITVEDVVKLKGLRISKSDVQPTDTPFWYDPNDREGIIRR